MPNYTFFPCTRDGVLPAMQAHFPADSAAIAHASTLRQSLPGVVRLAVVRGGQTIAQVPGSGLPTAVSREVAGSRKLIEEARALLASTETAAVRGRRAPRTAG